MTILQARPDEAKPRGLFPAAPLAAIPIVLTIILGLIGVTAAVREPAWSDTIWLMHVAGRMVDGARLYTDIIEVNPPLIFWAAAPIVALAHWLGVDPIPLWSGAVLVLAIGALLITTRLLRLLHPGWGLWPLPLLTFALLTIPGRASFGEREHLVAILLVPWLALSVVRLVRRPRACLATAAGVAAGLALALKPPFLLVILGVVAYQAWRVGFRRACRWPEHWATIALLAIYAGLVLIITPQFLGLARQLGPLYYAFHHQSISTMLIRWEPMAAVLVLLVALAVRLRRRIPEASPSQMWLDLVAIFLTGTVLSVLIQGKGLWYHYLPVSVGTVLLLGSLMAAHRGGVRLLAGSIALPMFALLLVWGTEEALAAESGEDHRYRELAGALDRAGRPASMLTFDASGAFEPFRYMHYAHVSWPSRWPFAWPIWALYNADLEHPGPITFRSPEKRPAIESWFIAAALTEADAARPDLVLIIMPESLGGRRLNVYDFLIVEPRFRTFLAGYTEGPQVGRYRVFRRRVVAARDSASSGAAGTSSPTLQP